MTGFYGADTEQLRAHAQLLKDRSRAIEDLRAQLEPQVLDESSWHGPDADAFRADWRGTTATFDTAVSQMTGFATRLEQEADEQDEVSEAEHQSFLDLLLDFFDDVTRGIIGAVVGIIGGALRIWKVLRALTDPAKLIKAIRGIVGTIYDKVLGVLGKWDTLMSKAPWLLKFGKVFGRFLPGIDIITGAWQMIDAIRKGDVFSAITGGATTLGGALIVAGTICDMTGVGAVVGVPLQVIGAVLVGGAAIADGVKWLVDNWDDVVDFGKDVWDATEGFREGVAEVWNATTDTIGNAWEATTDFVEDTWNTTVDTVSDWWDGATGGLRNLFG